MHPILHGYVAMSAAMLYIVLGIMALGVARIMAPSKLTPSKLKKHRDNIAATHFGHMRFTGILWVIFTVLYPATVGLVAVFRLS